MASQGRPGKASSVDYYRHLYQSRTLEPQGARRLCHHSHLCLQRYGQYYRFHGSGSFLQPALERVDCCPERHLHWSIWLWHMRCPASYLRLAR